MNKHILIPAVALIGALTACSSGPDREPPHTASVATDEVTSVSPVPTWPKTYGLKDEASWDGLSATLGTPDRGRTGKVGVPEDTHYVRIPVTIANDSRAPLNLDSIDVACATRQVYDGTNGLEGVPDVHVLPDKSLTWDIACAQTKNDRYLQLEISLEREDDQTAIFAGMIE